MKETGIEYVDRTRNEDISSEEERNGITGEIIDIFLFS